MIVKNDTPIGLFVLFLKENSFITPYNESFYNKKMSNISAYNHSTTEDILRYIVNFVKRK